MIVADNGESHPVRLLIDQGSELSFISEAMVHLLKLKRSSASIPLVGIGGVHSGRTKGTVTFQLRSIYNEVSSTVQAFILPRLTTRLPPFVTTSSNWPHLKDIPLADPEFYRPGPIHIILGSDIYGTIIMSGLIKGDSTTPTAQQTIFGWVLSGPVSASEMTQPIYGFHCKIDQALQESLTRFWLQEEISDSKTPILTNEEKDCEHHFVSTHYREHSGRYVVRLPLRADPTDLGNSKLVALNCLKRLSLRLSSDTIYQQLYVDFINEYRSLGHMTPVLDEESLSIPSYYLPHHGVLREQSTTTKLRVVFNGSSRTSNGRSLNDILHTGAKLQRDVVDVLLWSRKHRYLFSTDIVKMYRQIMIHPDDQNLQRILWYGSNNEIVGYRLTTVTYGLNCSPFLALRTIQQLVTDEGHRFPKAVVALTKGRYIDDILDGADSIPEAKEIQQQLIQLCNAGGFPLQKWRSNHPALWPKNSSIVSGEDTSLEIEPTLSKILGLNWKPETDTLHFAVQSAAILPITKRRILSDIAKLYDPLGLISPLLIRAKMLLQELWLLKVSWDEPLSPELQHRWVTFRQQLQDLNQLSIPRWLGLLQSNIQIEIHGFSDASSLAMAAVVYARIPNEDGEITVRLIRSKTRVAPLKKLTIPRLELTAAMLLAKLVTCTLKTLNLPETPIYLWTDSAVTLTWISAHPSRWKEFVRNRVVIIQETLPTAIWRFVPGKQNPADCASRGLTSKQLLDHQLWWKGPSWLSQPSTSWPSPINVPITNTNLEERPGQINFVATKQSYWNLLDRYSILNKLLRITTICRRFLSCLQKKPQATLDFPLTPIELQESLLFWTRIVQRAWFSNEIRILAKGETLPRSNPLIRLLPFIDRYGLLRVGGRLHNANIDTEAKHPLILPRSSPLTTLIIGDAHRRTLHGGTQVTQGHIRQNYWIVGGRAPIRSFILKCTRCIRHRALRAQQLMGQLPVSRVSQTRPFLNSGVDYAGPVTLKTWRGRAARTYKGYLAIFVCLSTSAIHLEIVTDYTTEAFIAAYKRFTGRRGLCATLQSDCGTNFAGADAELRRRFETTSKELKELASLLANDGTKWNFNPPSAPHFGGKWEAAVKSTKFHLLRVIGDTVLTYEELNTLLVQIEAVLNSRPLCPLSDDASDFAALTPGHFLIGEPPTLIPEPDLTTEPLNRLTRWQLIRQRVDHFWSRWMTECLQRYQAISKWHHPLNEIKENSLVLITDARYPPTKWPLARVVSLHPGPDGLTRVVTLRTATSVLKRPIVKVCVLPTDPDSSTTLLSKGGNMFGKEDKRENAPAITDVATRASTSRRRREDGGEAF